MTIGIRPEHFAPPTPGEAALAIKVDVAEHLGATTYVYAYANTIGGEQIIARRDRALDEPDAEEITVAIPTARAYLFDQRGAAAPSAPRPQTTHEGLT